MIVVYLEGRRLLLFLISCQNSSHPCLILPPINRLELQGNLTVKTMVEFIQTIPVISPSLHHRWVHRLMKVSLLTSGFLFMGWCVLALSIGISPLQGHLQS